MHVEKRDTMLKVAQRFLQLLAQEDGQDLVEYALILAFLALVGLATMKTFAASIAVVISGLGNKIVSVV